MSNDVTVRDVRMIQRSAERWNITPEFRSAAVRKLMTVILSPESSERGVVSAVKALAALDALNQKDEHANRLQFDRNRFLEIATRLGCRGDLEGSVETSTVDGVATINATATAAGGTRPGHRKKTRKKKRRGGNRNSGRG